jgi:arylsulfatase A-like enzyme
LDAQLNGGNQYTITFANGQVPPVKGFWSLTLYNAKHRYKHGDSEYIDGMLEHDDTVGTLLKALDDMGIADNTIVFYSSDNSPHMNTWPNGAMTWFRSEKNTNWDNAFRVPCLVRWPGKIKSGTVSNELMSHNDWIPTFCSIAG